MKKRFIITYLLTFALLWMFAHFITAREAGEEWATDPLHRRKGGHQGSHDVVYVQIIAEKSPGEFRLIPFADDQRWKMSDDHGRWPEELPGNRGHVVFVRNHQWTPGGPLVLRELTNFMVAAELTDTDLVPGSVLEDARRTAIRHARSFFDMPFLADDELQFGDGITRMNSLWRHGSYEPLVPLGLTITLFAFIPFVAAWAVTVATTRDEPEAE